MSTSFAALYSCAQVIDGDHRVWRSSPLTMSPRSIIRESPSPVGADDGCFAEVNRCQRSSIAQYARRSRRWSVGHARSSRPALLLDPAVRLLILTGPGGLSVRIAVAR
jgi:hypothetical protein